MTNVSVVKSPRPDMTPRDRQDGLMRAIDVTTGIIAIIVFAPVLLLVALCIYVNNPGPVLFVQRRIGRNGQVFNCFKFRTMVVDAEARLAHLLANDPAARELWDRDHKLRDDPRITSLGRFLRKSSLDELPQMFNLVIGTMSIVGPRPIVHAEVERYGRRFIDYCSVKPGITGLWQVSGRSNTTYRRRVAMDVAYSRKRSLGLNIKIIVMTLPAVIAAKGSY